MILAPGFCLLLLLNWMVEAQASWKTLLLRKKCGYDGFVGGVQIGSIGTSDVRERLANSPCGSLPKDGVGYESKENTPAGLFDEKPSRLKLLKIFTFLDRKKPGIESHVVVDPGDLPCSKNSKGPCNGNSNIFRDESSIESNESGFEVTPEDLQCSNKPNSPCNIRSTESEEVVNPKLEIEYPKYVFHIDTEPCRKNPKGSCNEKNKPNYGSSHIELNISTNRNHSFAVDQFINNGNGKDQECNSNPNTPCKKKHKPPSIFSDSMELGSSGSDNQSSEFLHGGYIDDDNDQRCSSNPFSPCNKKPKTPGGNGHINKEPHIDNGSGYLQLNISKHHNVSEGYLEIFDANQIIQQCSSNPNDPCHRKLPTSNDLVDGYAGFDSKEDLGIEGSETKLCSSNPKRPCNKKPKPPSGNGHINEKPYIDNGSGSLQLNVSHTHNVSLGYHGTFDGNRINQQCSSNPNDPCHRKPPTSNDSIDGYAGFDSNEDLGIESSETKLCSSNPNSPCNKKSEPSSGNGHINKKPKPPRGNGHINEKPYIDNGSGSLQLNVSHTHNVSLGYHGTFDGNQINQQCSSNPNHPCHRKPPTSNDLVDGYAGLDSNEDLGIESSETKLCSSNPNSPCNKKSEPFSGNGHINKKPKPPRGNGHINEKPYIDNGSGSLQLNVSHTHNVSLGYHGTFDGNRINQQCSSNPNDPCHRKPPTSNDSLDGYAGFDSNEDLGIESSETKLCSSNPNSPCNKKSEPSSGNGHINKKPKPPRGNGHINEKPYIDNGSGSLQLNVSHTHNVSLGYHGTFDGNRINQQCSSNPNDPCHRKPPTSNDSLDGYAGFDSNEDLGIESSETKLCSSNPNSPCNKKSEPSSGNGHINKKPKPPRGNGHINEKPYIDNGSGSLQLNSPHNHYLSLEYHGTFDGNQINQQCSSNPNHPCHRKPPTSNDLVDGYAGFDSNEDLGIESSETKLCSSNPKRPCNKKPKPPRENGHINKKPKPPRGNGHINEKPYIDNGSGSLQLNFSHTHNVSLGYHGTFDGNQINQQCSSNPNHPCHRKPPTSNDLVDGYAGFDSNEDLGIEGSETKLCSSNPKRPCNKKPKPPSENGHIKKKPYIDSGGGSLQLNSPHNHYLSLEYHGTFGDNQTNQQCSSSPTKPCHRKPPTSVGLVDGFDSAEGMGIETYEDEICSRSPCGLNAHCRSEGGRAICSCEFGSYGNPLVLCQPGVCIRDEQCENHLSCIDGQCVDLCHKSCGINAFCEMVNHKPLCQCLMGFNGNPLVECRHTEICSPNPCGANSVCKSVEGRPVCLCAPGYYGDPMRGCEHECEHDTECAKNQACVDFTCQDACKLCGKYADCESVAVHKPICKCPVNYYGNPYVACKPECTDHSDCPKNKPTCHQFKCKNPCDGGCGVQANCEIQGVEAVCSCPEHLTGNPMVLCRPFERKDFCEPFPCGSHSKCDLGVDDLGRYMAVCNCLPGYYKRTNGECLPGDCEDDAHCPDHKACMDFICDDPCTGECGTNSFCETHNHTAVCSCNAGYEGNPVLGCTKKLKCTTSTVCTGRVPIKLLQGK